MSGVQLTLVRMLSTSVAQLLCIGPRRPYGMLRPGEHARLSAELLMEIILYFEKRLVISSSTVGAVTMPVGSVT